MRAGGANPGLGMAILRVALGVVFVAHGAPKLFGGMPEFSAFLGDLGVPLAGAVAWGVTLLEFFGGLALLAGFLTVPLSLLLAFHMLMGIILVHAEAGWYVVGGAAQHPPGGVEFNVVLIAALTALALAGPGAAALDGRLGRRAVPEPGGQPAAEAGPGKSGRLEES